MEPNQHAEAFDMNNILQSVKVLNHHQFPDGTYAQEGEEFQTIEFIDGNVNYTQEVRNKCHKYFEVFVLYHFLYYI